MVWHSGTLIVNNSAFFNNTGVYPGVRLGGAPSTTNLNNNWWGSNNPDFNTLIDVNRPETWIIMNFTTQDTINLTNNGNIQLETTLNTLFNKTSGNFTIINNSLPTRTVYYTTNDGTLNKIEDNITQTTNNTLTYTYGNINTIITATIDNQTLKLTIPNINLNFTYINNTSPNLGETITFTINITNNDLEDITYTQGLEAIIVNLTLPQELTYISSTTTGYYDNNTGLWYVGNLSSGETKSLIIIANITSGIGQTVNIKTNIQDGHILKANQNTWNDTTTIKIRSKTGSYTQLQKLIDETPSGGVLYLCFDVVFDPACHGPNGPFLPTFLRHTGGTYPS